MNYISKVKFAEKKNGSINSLFKDELMEVLKIHKLEFIYDIMENPSHDFSIFYTSSMNNHEFKILFYSYVYFHVSRRFIDGFNNYVDVYEFLNNKQKMLTKRYSKNGVALGLYNKESNLEYACNNFKIHGCHIKNNHISFVWLNRVLL